MYRTMGGGAALDPSRTVAGCFPGQRLVSYCAGAVFMIVCGSLYAFSSISGDLQVRALRV
ncbi:hypothetical protein EON66_02525 [archaeon]|nr:MAG: hypothetical protein EON66_02525 [archaeon]